MAAFILLDAFDPTDIYEAPSQEIAAKVSLRTMSKGAVKAETWGALPYRNFLKLTKQL